MILFNEINFLERFTSFFSQKIDFDRQVFFAPFDNSIDKEQQFYLSKLFVDFGQTSI
jgi:hypothetical protein